MKHLVPIHVANYVGSPGSVQPGFKKFYLKNGYFKLYDGANENDVVLDRPLDGFVPIPGTITAADSVLTAIEKLDFAINSINPSVNWGSITGNILAQTDLIAYIATLPASPLSALPFTTDHLTATNNQYVVGDLVWYLGNVYRCIANNDSIIPTSTLYWTNLGAGYPIVQQPSDWNATSGNNQILNKPTIPTLTSQLTNDSGFLTQESVLEFPTFSSFPLVGAANTIYIAVDTDIAYYWDGVSYQVVTTSTSGITGFGTINTLPKFTPTGSQLGNSRFTDNGLTGRYGSTNNYVEFITGANRLLRLFRSQAIFDVILGNPEINQELILDSTNNFGAAFRSRGYTAFRVGALGTTEPLRLLSTGQIQLPVTPATGLTSDFILVRDTSGNLKQIAYPTIPTVGTWGALNYPTWTTGTPFVKMTAAGTFALDTTVYYPNSNPSNFITSPLIAKGDIFVRNATVDTRLPVGTDGQILTANSSVPEGLSWQDNYADWTSTVKHIVKNNGLSGTITKGTAVYVTGSDGTNKLVGRASNTSEATSSKTMGLMQSDITTTGPNQTGFVITEGLLGGLNTAGQTAGDPVWLGAGGTLLYGLINKPYAPAHLVFIGIVTKVSAGNGEIFVKVQNGFELKEIHDVDLVSNAPTNNQVLTYESATDLWKNKTIVEDVIVDGVTSRAPSQNAVFDAFTLRKRQIVNDSVTSTVTGTTTPTIVKSYQFLPGTLTPSGFLEMYLLSIRTGLSLAHTMNVFINTTNSLSGATLIGGFITPGNFSPVFPMKLFFVLKDNLIVGGLVSQSTMTNLPSSATFVSAPCNNTINPVWILVTITPGATNQVIGVQGVEIIN
jgi:hypothetical protein